MHSSQVRSSLFLMMVVHLPVGCSRMIGASNSELLRVNCRTLMHIACMGTYIWIIFGKEYHVIVSILTAGAFAQRYPSHQKLLLLQYSILHQHAKSATEQVHTSKLTPDILWMPPPQLLDEAPCWTPLHCLSTATHHTPLAPGAQRLICIPAFKVKSRQL